MSIIKQGPMKGTSGKVDDLQLVYKTMRDGTTYASKLPLKPETPVRYLRQMERRSQMASVGNCYSPFRGQLNFSFEIKRPGQNMRNIFMKYNLKYRRGCYLTKQQREAGFQVLGNFFVSSGPETIPSVNVNEQQTTFLTDISLGDLVIDASTTQAQFAQAVGESNGSRFCVRTTQSRTENLGFDTAEPVRDSITLMIARQMIEVGTGKPSILVDSYQIPLLCDEQAQSRPLSQLFDVARLTTTPVTTDGVTRNCLTLRKSGAIELFTVIHSRRKGDGPVLCSTQALSGTNPMRAIFLTPEARAYSFESYGGVNMFNSMDPDNETPAKYTNPTASDITAFATFTSNKYDGALPKRDPALGGNLKISSDGGNSGNPDPTKVQLTFSVNNTALGSVTPESGLFTLGSTIQAVATPKSNAEFTGWSDGVTSATRTITVSTSVTTYTANFRSTGGLGVWLLQHPDATPQQIAAEMRRLKKAGEL